MKDSEKISLSLYKVVLSIRDTLSLPTHKTLEKSLYLSIALFVCSAISTLLGFYTFISWQGALICTISLVVLLFMERNENDTLLRMYKSAQVAAKRVKKAATPKPKQRNMK